MTFFKPLPKTNIMKTKFTKFKEEEKEEENALLFQQFILYCFILNVMDIFCLIKKRFSKNIISLIPLKCRGTDFPGVGSSLRFSISILKLNQAEHKLSCPEFFF
jgi:hypothetical protein